MVFLRSTFLLVAILFSSAVLIESALNKPRQAIAVLKSDTTNIIDYGTIIFTETENGTIRVHGALTGLEPGLYGFHIHTHGDVTRCFNTGLHFDYTPDGSRVHGGRLHELRHVGDFGNVKFEEMGNGEPAVATVDFEDSRISFSGDTNILGRSLVLHQDEDDLGEGGNDLSHIDGHSGPAAACAVIGILSGTWNSGIATYSTSSLVIFGIVFLFLNQ